MGRSTSVPGSRSSTASSTVAGPSGWSSRCSGSSATIAVRLWQARLDLDDGGLSELEGWLSDAERAHADALREAEVRRRWVADHLSRRRLLANLLGCAPEEVRYAGDHEGKPRLAGPATRPYFNASRSEEAALYATCETAAVGVDVEAITGDVDVAALARRTFSPTEHAALQRLPESDRRPAAFACWTRKEAYAKARGTGLVFPLDGIEVWAGDERPVRHGEIEVRGVDLAPGMAAAVAVVTPPGTEVSVSPPERVILG